ncbi:MAG TPA: glycoside hydrolase family 32 protein [Agriterribacter sp.]|nr:glycoside hydrolase family 32 protein [Agriterribacter sp.]
MNCKKCLNSFYIILLLTFFLRYDCKAQEYFSYHLANPIYSITGDPNCGFYWKGRYHLFYMDQNRREEASFAHVSSKDMVHWKWHPNTLTPATMGHNMFSGTGFYTKEGRPAIIYHGEGSGRNQISFAEDDMLEKWSKPIPVDPKTKDGKAPVMRHWDPDCWIMDGTYYAISGGKDPELMKSDDLKHWQYVGKLLADSIPNDLGVPRDEDISCPNMFRIGNKWMLLNLSHWLGARYYLGHFENEKYVPEFHDRMNWMCEFNKDADVFAPESLLTPDGRRVMWAWSRMRVRLKTVNNLQGAIQTLPRELSLQNDTLLLIRPIKELESLRYRKKQETNIRLEEKSKHLLKNVSGDALEVKLSFEVKKPGPFGITVYADQNGDKGFPITFDPHNNVFRMDTTIVPLQFDGNRIEARVFIDKNIIEVFVNDRRAALAPHLYEAGDIYTALFSDGGDILVRKVNSWKMRSIYSKKATKGYNNRK